MSGEYRAVMGEFASMTNLSAWYAHRDIETALDTLRSGVNPAVRKRAEADLAKARTPNADCERQCRT